MSRSSLRRRSFPALNVTAIAAAAVLASSLLPIDAAAENDTVNIYTTRQEVLIQPVLDAYRAATGAEVNVIFIKEGLVERLKSEGANSPADVILTADVGYILEADEAGLLQPVDLVGDGPQASALRQLAGELGITERVLFTGRVPFEKIPKHLKAADLFAFASVTETQGLVTLEALAAGLPVAAVAGPGTQDIIDDGVQGLLVKNEPHELANGIVKLIGNPDLMARFKSAALQKAQEYDHKQLARQMLKVSNRPFRIKRRGNLSACWIRRH